MHLPGLGKGTIFYERSKYDEAIQAYDKAIQLDPNNAIVWNNEGNALQALGRKTESKSAFAKQRTGPRLKWDTSQKTICCIYFSGDQKQKYMQTLKLTICK
jgi:tetratricopeptide (TPR) repeat protein